MIKIVGHFPQTAINQIGPSDTSVSVTGQLWILAVENQVMVETLI